MDDPCWGWTRTVAPNLTGKEAHVVQLVHPASKLVFDCIHQENDIRTMLEEIMMSQSSTDLPGRSPESLIFYLSGEKTFDSDGTTAFDRIRAGK